jgi:hypothetical protein
MQIEINQHLKGFAMTNSGAWAGLVLANEYTKF